MITVASVAAMAGLKIWSEGLVLFMALLNDGRLRSVKRNRPCGQS
jgi:hypothetical protein